MLIVEGTGIVELDICSAQSFALLRDHTKGLWPVLIVFLGGSAMNCVFPHVVELLVATSDVIVEDWLAPDVFQ